MSNADCEIRIGTSGWYYEHWKGRFYPEDLPKNKWLEYYISKFDTVEINNTFYHLPQEQTLKHWNEIAPPDFLFTVKASRYITHIKRLKDIKDSLGLFFDRVKLLKKHAGPILYQLPPSFKIDLELLESFLKLLPKKYKSVFEFRNKSWYEDDTFKLLDDFNTGFCIHDLGGEQTPKKITGKLIYVRFHGASGPYAGSYTESMMRDWAKWIKKNQKNAGACYVYFNNDSEGHAVANARTLKLYI